MNYSYLLIHFLIHFICLNSFAQNVYFQQFDTKDGLPSSEIYDVIQDDKGYLWFTSDKGLIKYDFNDFKVLGINEGLSNMVNFTFFQESNNTFWINGLDGTFSYWDGNTLSPFKFNNVLKQNAAFHNAWHEIIDIKNNTISFVLSNRPDNRIFKININTGELNMSFSNELKHSKKCSPKISKLINYYNTTFKYRPKDLGKYLFAYSFLTPELYKVFNKYENKGIINEFEFNNNLWLLTNTGIEIRNLKNPSKLIKSYNFNASVSACKILDNGEIWLTTTSNGIIRVPNKDIELIEFSNSHDINVDDIILFNKTIFVRSINNQLYELNKNKSRLVTQNVFKGINSLVESNKGSGKKFYFANMIIDENNLITKTYPLDLHIPINDNLNIISRHRIINFKLANNEDDKSFLLDKYIKIIELDLIGDQLFYSTINGFYKISTNISKKNEFKIDTLLFNTRVNTFEKDHDGIWLGSLGKGLFYCQNETCFHIDSLLENTNILCLKQENSKTIWVGTNKGLFKISYLVQGNFPKASRVVLYTVNDGLPSNYIKDIEISNDSICVGTDKGFVKFASSKIQKDSKSPKIDLEYIKFNENNYTDYSENIQVSNLENDIEIKFNTVTPDKSINTNKAYNYRLTLDRNKTSEWQNLSNGLIRFSNQNPGNYLFEVKGKNSNDQWSEIKSISFSIIPPIYQTPLFKLTSVLILITALFYIWNKRTQRLKQKLSLELRLKSSELNTLRNQMNPHFIFNSLNAVQSYIFSDKKVEANFYIHNISKLVRKSLDFSRREKITIEEEVYFVSSYLNLEKMRHGREVRTKVVCNIPDMSTKIPPLLVQPLIENSLKHAFKKQSSDPFIEIVYNSNEKFLFIEVRDNGSGYNPRKIQKSNSSLGTEIIKQRISLINERNNSDAASFRIKSVFGEGTICTIQLPKL